MFNEIHISRIRCSVQVLTDSLTQPVPVCYAIPAWVVAWTLTYSRSPSKTGLDWIVCF